MNFKQMRRMCMIGLLNVCLLASCTPSRQGGTTTTTTGTTASPVVAGKVLSVVDYGAVPNSDQDATDAIEDALKAAKNGDTIFFPEGSYNVSRIITLAKKSITLKGEKATLIQTAYDNASTLYQATAGFFYIIGENITIKGLDFDFAEPANFSGTVTEVNTAESYFMVKLYDEFMDATGEEYFNYVYSHDADGTVNGHVAGDGGGIKFKYLGDGVLQVYYASGPQLDNLEVGEGMTIRLGHSAAPMFSIQGAINTVFEDVNIYQANMVWYIASRSENVTFNHTRVTMREGSKQLMVTNVDIIHVENMKGKLVIKDCQFDGLGDDALNVHTRAGKIQKISPDTGDITMVAGWHNKAVDSYWAKEGDMLEFYDSETLLLKGTAKVVSMYGTLLTVDAIPDGVTVNDAIANVTMTPAVEVTGTTISRGRARGLLLQTKNVLIENCNINRMTLSGILLACDYAYWYEMCPSTNIRILNNTLEKCSRGYSSASYAGITVKASHDAGAAAYPAGVHQNLEISGNKISNCGGSGIFVSATDQLKLENNVIEGNNLYSTPISTATYAIALVNCSGVTVKGNSCDKGVQLLYSENCQIVSNQ